MWLHEIITIRYYLSIKMDQRFGTGQTSWSERSINIVEMTYFYFLVQCRKTAMVIGDALDNDCDGKRDEEILDGKDDDVDGYKDEDVAKVRNFLSKLCIYMLKYKIF